MNVNPGVADAVAPATATGTLHDAPVDHRADISKTLGNTVTQPGTTLSVVATPTCGRAPLTVTDNYSENGERAIPFVAVATGSGCPLRFARTQAAHILEAGAK